MSARKSTETLVVGSRGCELNILIAFYLFVAFLAVYILSGSVFTNRLFDVGVLRMEVLTSLMENSDLSVQDGTGLKGADGRDYSWFGIGSVLMAVPFYGAGKLLGIPPYFSVSIMNQVVGAATVSVVFLCCIAHSYSKLSSASAAIIYGLGTMAWYYAKDPGDHAIETLFSLLAFYNMYLFTCQKHCVRLYLSAICLGISILTRPSSVLFIPPLLMLMTFSSEKEEGKSVIKSAVRNVFMFSLTLIPFAALILWYNYYRYGSIYESGYSLMASRWGIVSLFNGTSILTGLYGLLASPGKGLFYYSPVGVFFFFSITTFAKKHRWSTICFFLIISLYLIFYSKYLYWHGDWGWGPRYIFVLTPYIIIPVAALLDSEAGKNSAVRISIACIFIASLVVQLGAVSVNVYKYFHFLENDQHVTFIVVRGNGTQPIREPPSEVYFDWHKSPISTQFRFVKELSAALRRRSMTPPYEPAAMPWMNCFDTWWMYRLCWEGDRSVLYPVLLIFVIGTASTYKVVKAVREK